jgi:multicomponent Na+:H+ antiporter subunit G
MVITFLAVLFLAFGLVLFTGGGVGLLRMPDFYSRLHPAGKLDTLGIMSMVGGLALYNLALEGLTFSHVLVSLKMLLIAIFVFHSSPTATHAIVDAGIRAGLKPWTREERR